MRRIVALLGLLVLVVSVAGCGGGGGGSAPTQTGSAVRQMQAGDQVQYSFTGVYRAFNGVTSPASGTVVTTTYADTATPLAGGRRLRDVTEINLTAAGVQLSRIGTNYYEQVPNGTIYDYGYVIDGNDARLVESSDDPVGIKSPLAVGNQWSVTGQYRDDSTRTTDASVTALEPVNGQMAYKIHTTCTTDNGSSSSDVWLVPDWGCSIKFTLNIGAYSGIATMVSKSF